MAVLSTLRPIFRHHRPFSTATLKRSVNRNFVIHPSRFVQRRFFNHLHWYTCLSFIIYLPTVLYLNITQGPAELAEIPDGYYPEEYEYYKNPVTRAWMRYAFAGEQISHEKTLATIANESEAIWYRKREKFVRALQAERRDYQGWFWSDVQYSRYFEYLYDFYTEAYNENLYPEGQPLTY